MSNERRLIFRNIIGDAQATINAIQKYITENSPSKTINDVECEIEEAPADSINRVINAVACEETNAEIQGIINRL
ncbi:MAG: hypothetical protein E7Z90_02220 [Cyanobacteria bacterium SIG29]|nr:hypothetical protein [Cyanobacteria bacterium SIG29]